jgi:hypothetical protein
VYSAGTQQKQSQKRVQRPACRIVTSGGEVVGTAAAEVVETAGMLRKEETVALDCEDGWVRGAAPDCCGTLVWGGRELPAEACFAFLSFSLFNRTSLAETFLCVI